MLGKDSALETGVFSSLLWEGPDRVIKAILLVDFELKEQAEYVICTSLKEINQRLFLKYKPSCIKSHMYRRPHNYDVKMFFNDIHIFSVT